MPELWQPIKGYEGLYEVSDQGRVRRHYIHRPTRTLKLSKDIDGYNRVCLSKNNVTKDFRVARLVALSFVEGDKSLTVNHKDLDKTNDHASNLEWISSEDNIRHSYQNGRRLKYSRREWEVLLKRIEQGEKQVDLAAELGMSRQSFHQMKKRFLRGLQ